MNDVKCFGDLFGSIPDYRKNASLKFLNKNDKDILHDCGYLKSDINRVLLEFKGNT